MCADGQERLESNSLELQLQYHKKYVIENILTLRCPAQNCRQGFIEKATEKTPRQNKRDKKYKQEKKKKKEMKFKLREKKKNAEQSKTKLLKRREKKSHTPV